MARVVKVFRTLRNHWKKSAFAVCVLSYGGHWLYGKHCDNILRREACLLARDFGRQLMAPQEQLRKATVILNPAACNGKANNLFEKNAAPILHLAGVEITLVKTDYEGQAKKLMELLEHTDILIVAGGDGTMQEVITGLLRRPDQEKMSGIPIGFIPLGSTNSLSPSLHLLNDNKVKDITSATLSILRGVTVPLDVLQIKGEKDQPVFALMGLQWGAFRDAASKISKYWYLGPLKTYAAHWFSTLREWPLVRDISISHLAPTLRPPDQPFEKPPRPSLLYRIARRLKNYWNPPIEEPPKLEEPEQWKEEKLSTLELLVQTHNNNPVERRINDSLVIHAEPDNFSVADFITVGNAKTKDPIIFSKNSTILEASACRLQLPEGAGGFYNIDNEEYEAMPVEVRLLPRKLRFFISAERRAQFLSLTQGEKDIKNDNSTETT
ncbi:acylglycerol kinase, mitochondrial isoform X1 [Takifugu rubripes]|uniref:acylglycerol kinase, mitochondrial isoform X1 n=2 Tax=Takifugu rubripes TaxID=31033 RepID=UPI000298C654|nr:acylglycerol kinase, mitochondrial isoform X1 [Takifugu rubripes]|eukprot:XP_003967240.1 PREDICTED: acylglycerol kinase, mitochondrial isoform X1 [Takifugu rubripes]